MNKRVNKTDVSAYLDGEAADADRIRESLAHDGAAARECDAYARLSDGLRRLPAPEVSASFADAVVARVESECAEEVATARLAGRIAALPQPEVRTSFADSVIARIESEHAEQTALARMLGRLKAALPEPDVHPGFARRVVAAIESAPQRQPIRWRVPVSSGVLAAAVIAFAIGLAVIEPLPATDAPTQVAAPAPEVEPAAPVRLDESALLAQIERRLVADADVQQIVLARFEPAAQPADLYSARLLNAFTGSTGARAGEAFRGADYRSTLRHMDKAQTVTLKQLLEASVEEAHEG